MPALAPILKARDPRERAMLVLIRSLEAELEALWADLIAYLERTNKLAEVAARIEAGAGVEAITQVDEVAARYATGWGRAYVRAGVAAEADIVAQGVTAVDFDATNHRAVNHVRQNRLQLIQQVTQGQRDAIREALVQGVTSGVNPIEQARAVRRTIGLTAYQTRIVENYRRALLGLDVDDVMSRRLRDRRYDRTVEAAVRNKRPLTQAQVDAMVERYRQRWVKYRSQVIARTEALRAAHEGTEEVYQQAIDAGELSKDQLVRIWHHSGNRRNPRDFHISMSGQRRRVGEPFVSGEGNLLMYPGDPSAPASETTQCGCMVTTRILPPGQVFA